MSASLQNVSLAHRLHLSEELYAPSPTSVLILTLNQLSAWALGNAEYLFIAINPWSTLTRSGSTW